MSKLRDLFCLLEYDRKRAHPRIDTVHDTLGSAQAARTAVIRNRQNAYKAEGINARLAASGTHILDDQDEVLTSYHIQRAEHVTRTRKVTGRGFTTGKFETRLELEEFVLMKYFTTTESIAAISRQAKISQPVADRIISEKGSAYRLEVMGG